MRLTRSWMPDAAGSQSRLITAWFRPSLVHEFKDDTKTEFSSEMGDIPFQADLHGGTAELVVGMYAQITGDISLYVTINYQTGLDGRSNSIAGKFGLKATW